MYIYIYMCVCVCVCVRERLMRNVLLYIYIFNTIYNGETSLERAFTGYYL